MKAIDEDIPNAENENSNQVYQVNNIIKQGTIESEDNNPQIHTFDNRNMATISGIDIKKEGIKRRGILTISKNPIFPSYCLKTIDESTFKQPVISTTKFLIPNPIF